MSITGISSLSACTEPAPESARIPRQATDAEVRRAFERLSAQWDSLWELADEETRELMIKVAEQFE